MFWAKWPCNWKALQMNSEKLETWHGIIILPHSMCKIVERVTEKTRRTSCTNWKISFGVSGFQMSFRPKPWYFERDCPVCTWSASSFCRNPLYFFAHAMQVKWWYLANFQPFQSSFCSAFHFHGDLALKKISKCIGNSKLCQKGLKVDDVGLNCASERKKSPELY